MDKSWTRINRPIITGTIKRYLYIFYKSVPGERPITRLSLSVKDSSNDDDTSEAESSTLGKNMHDDDDGDEACPLEQGAIDTGIRYKNGNIYVTYERSQSSASDRRHDPQCSQAIDNIAIEMGSNPVPYNWKTASFEHDASQEVPDWNVQLIYRRWDKALPTIPKLRFRQDGTFKIVQFADIHMATGPHACYNAPVNMKCTGDVNTQEMMDRVLDAEKPDLVVYTGDNVDGVTSKDALSTILKYSRPVIDRHIPWAIVFGNHDEEGDLSREEMMSSVQDLPYSLSQRGPPGISGTGNYHLSIFRHKYWGQDGQFDQDEYQTDMDMDMDESVTEEQDNDLVREKSLFTLYFLDSGAYSFNIRYPGWAWIMEDQVEWFRQTSRAITSRYRQSQIPNALAFFHIPIPEYSQVEEGTMVGDKNEGVSSPSYNSGMFEAFFESKDVRATTVGHDHINDYCLDHRGINLCYGGGLGYGSYGNSNVFRRSRVFEIRNHGDRADTWKRLDNLELDLVGQQTLFVGKKSTPPSSRSGPTSSSQTKRGPTRLTDELLKDLTRMEGLTRNTQYVLSALDDQ
ncbi:Metallo-dependent phosphatase-like protein [Mortierella sp. GBAus27b]|nr:Metallo-dependent phosphatase-like protein [Mortierella sp. GBAus27b]